MPIPTDVQILTAIDSASHDYLNGLVPMERVFATFPSIPKGILIKRLTALSDAANDVVEYLPGDDGGFRITGNAGHASDEETASWIIEWSQKKL